MNLSEFILGLRTLSAHAVSFASEHDEFYVHTQGLTNNLTIEYLQDLGWVQSDDSRDTWVAYL